MAQKNLSSNEWKLPIQDSGGKPMGLLQVGEGTSSSFTCLVLDVGGASYYYWPSSAGVLRYGTTQPTTSTQNSAGAAV